VALGPGGEEGRVVAETQIPSKPHDRSALRHGFVVPDRPEANLAVRPIRGTNDP
jgi:hypothetical protein